MNVFQVAKKKSTSQFVQNVWPISQASVIPDGQVERDLQMSLGTTSIFNYSFLF